MQAGDLVVAVFIFSSNAASFTGPGGSWVEVLAPTSTNIGTVDPRLLAIYYQFDPASGPTGTTTNAAGRQTVICQAYGGVDTSTPIDAAAAVNADSVGDTQPLPAPSITTVTANALLLSALTHNASSQTYTEPAGMTMEASTAGAGVGRGGALAREVRATPGATGTRTFAASGSTTVSSVAANFALRPAAGGGGGRRDHPDVP